jgi:L-ribulose-5-phosphate 3-epimerase UlaE
MLFADSAPAVTSIEGIFLQYGLIGAVALVLGLYARSAIRATEERSRRLEDDNRRLYQIMFDQMVPALQKANDTIAIAIDLFTEMRRTQEREAAIDEARKLVEAERQRRDGATP